MANEDDNVGAVHTGNKWNQALHDSLKCSKCTQETQNCNGSSTCSVKQDSGTISLLNSLRTDGPKLQISIFLGFLRNPEDLHEDNKIFLF